LIEKVWHILTKNTDTFFLESMQLGGVSARNFVKNPP
jgi:hypothetical protein